jgi:hypothetical protein
MIMDRVFYHRTSAENAELILRDKFCACTENPCVRGLKMPLGLTGFMRSAEKQLQQREAAWNNLEHHRNPHSVWSGVWISNVPLAPFRRRTAQDGLGLDGEHGSALLEVVIDATAAFLEAHEWKIDPLDREWLIPAKELNARILSIRKVTLREAAEASRVPVYSMLEYQRLREDDFARADLENANPLKALAQIMRLKNG